MLELSEWDSFYLIVGGASGALIGLQFVVMTLIAGRPIQSGPEVGAAFATPTIIHFGAAFLLSAAIRAPWKTLTPVIALLALIGLSGVVYSVVVARRMRSQTKYKPVFEDWLFHAWLPLVAYGILAASAAFISSNTHDALFGVGSSVLLLLFVGIHNAWDTVTYNVFVNTGNTSEPEQPLDGDEPDPTK